MCNIDFHSVHIVHMAQVLINCAYCQYCTTLLDIAHKIAQVWFADVLSHRTPRGRAKRWLRVLPATSETCCGHAEWGFTLSEWATCNLFARAWASSLPSEILFAGCNRFKFTWFRSRTSAGALVVDSEARAPPLPGGGGGGRRGITQRSSPAKSNERSTYTCRKKLTLLLCAGLSHLTQS